MKVKLKLVENVTTQCEIVVEVAEQDELAFGKLVESMTDTDGVNFAGFAEKMEITGHEIIEYKGNNDIKTKVSCPKYEVV